MAFSHMPGRVLIFGAGGRIGGAVARKLQYLAPDICLRLVTSRRGAAADLMKSYPTHEVVVADFNEASTIHACFADIDAAFLVTPNFLDEHAAMGHIVAGVRKSSGFRQLFRIVGDQPGMTPRRVPDGLRNRPGPAMQHYQARQVLEQADLPTVFLNTANLMSNLFANAPGIVEHGVLAQPPRTHGWIDVDDVAEVAALLIKSGDQRHTGQTYDLDNNYDVISWEQVTEILASVLMRPMIYDPSPQGFLKHVGPVYRRKMGFDDADRYFLQYFTWEAHNDLAWRRTDFVERMLGRRPKTVRAWIEQNYVSFVKAP